MSLLNTSDGGAMCRQFARQLARVLDDPRYDALSMRQKIDLSVGDDAQEPRAGRKASRARSRRR